MKLELKLKLGDMIECYCDLTRTLDELAGLTDKESLRKHYILVDSLCKKNRCLAIRIPGGTVGSLHYDENYVITDINIDTNYVVNTYVENVNEIIKGKYIGIVIE